MQFIIHPNRIHAQFQFTLTLSLLFNVDKIIIIIIIKGDFYIYLRATTLYSAHPRDTAPPVERQRQRQDQHTSMQSTQAWMILVRHHNHLPLTC